MVHATRRQFITLLGGAAAATVEHPSLAARLGNIAGKPIELVGRAFPDFTGPGAVHQLPQQLQAIWPR
jgi:hypothetical protein